MKFCPKCGSPRAGKFCESCGFEFPVPASNATLSPDAPKFEEPDDTPQPNSGKPPLGFEEQADQKSREPGWYPDPLQERLWDGDSWTDVVRPTSAQSKRSSHPRATAEAGGQPVYSSEKVQKQEKPLLEGLSYGASFIQGSNCYNCGHVFEGSVLDCGLCGAIS